jgi:hypothetical protein
MAYLFCGLKFNHYCKMNCRFCNVPTKDLYQQNEILNKNNNLRNGINEEIMAIKGFLIWKKKIKFGFRSLSNNEKISYKMFPIII